MRRVAAATLAAVARAELAAVCVRVTVCAASEGEAPVSLGARQLHAVAALAGHVLVLAHQRERGARVRVQPHAAGQAQPGDALVAGLAAVAEGGLVHGVVTAGAAPSGKECRRAPALGASVLPRSWHVAQATPWCPPARLSPGCAKPRVSAQLNSLWHDAHCAPRRPAWGSWWHDAHVPNSMPSQVGGVPCHSAHSTLRCAPRRGKRVTACEKSVRSAWWKSVWL